jgi:hypothetical protein
MARQKMASASLPSKPQPATVSTTTPPVTHAIVGQSFKADYERRAAMPANATGIAIITASA